MHLMLDFEANLAIMDILWRIYSALHLWPLIEKGEHLCCPKTINIQNYKLTTLHDVLSLTEENEGLKVHSDASKDFLGCVLMHTRKVGLYTSWQMKLFEVNYPIHD